jgi:oligoribonuclease NrnB/cAMP/cGMP phosphodiesterase (DHH superfamily)
VISKKDLKKYQSQTGDTEGLVNYALSLDGIKLAALFSEREDGIKISFRSSSDVAVNKFAASYFKGGGHKNAAGGKSTDSLKETVERFEEDLTDAARPHAPMRAVAMIGEAIEVSPERARGVPADPATLEIRQRLESLMSASLSHRHS